MAYRVFFDGMPEVRLTELSGIPTKLVIPGFALCKQLPGLDDVYSAPDEAKALAEAIAKANGLRLGSVRSVAKGWTATFTTKRKLKPERANAYMPVAEVRFRVSARRGIGEREQ